MRRLSVRPNDRVRAIYDVLRLPDVRRIEFGWGASVIGELAGQVTLVVYAFDAGGAVLVATHVASRTLLADQALRTLALDRETFLVAVTGNSMSSAEADALVTRRLTAGL